VLHVWARRPSSLDTLDGVPYIAHDTVVDLGAASEIVGLCLNEDKDNRQLMLDAGLLAAMRSGSVLVNHGTGLPAFAVEMTKLAAEHGIDVLDAPVSGGRAGAIAKQLTTIVGGDAAVLQRVRPVIATFSKKVVYMGGAGTGQVGKLINNALLMANQKNIADLLGVAQRLDVDIPGLLDVLRSGSASSFALQALGTAVTPANAEHLRRIQLVDVDIFVDAVAGLGDSVAAINRRAIEGAEALPRLADLITA
jgi:3-hydroxyisobutyrate dehydrogenase